MVVSVVVAVVGNKNPKQSCRQTDTRMPEVVESFPIPETPNLYHAMFQPKRAIEDKLKKKKDPSKFSGECPLSYAALEEC